MSSSPTEVHRHYKKVTPSPSRLKSKVKNIGKAIPVNRPWGHIKF
jgi:hypothetical protein